MTWVRHIFVSNAQTKSDLPNLYERDMLFQVTFLSMWQSWQLLLLRQFKDFRPWHQTTVLWEHHQIVQRLMDFIVQALRILISVIFHWWNNSNADIVECCEKQLNCCGAICCAPDQRCCNGGDNCIVCSIWNKIWNEDSMNAYFQEWNQRQQAIN